MNVCEALLEVLHGYGVEFIFGIPGDAINELTEAIRKQNKIRFIHVMHEEAGAFAAAAQAKLTGKLAVCAGTAGPGAIHLLNGLYDAKMDRAPVLAITGQVETSLRGTDYQQEVNLVRLFSDVSVYNRN
jgi:pyruvate oxidase